MNDIEQKALALLNDVRTERGFAPVEELYGSVLLGEALCRAIEQHEAFRQEVSDVVEDYFHPIDFPSVFQHFIIPKPKPDPLVEVVQKVGLGVYNPARNWAGEIRAALEAYGLEIREKGQ